MRILLFLLIFSFQFTIQSQIQFPTANAGLGYEKSTVHARVAYPLNNQGRVWVKGSLEHPIVKIIEPDSAKVLHQVALEAPFYTDVLAVNLKEVTVQFCDVLKNCFTYATLYPGHFNDIKGKDFSVLLYGCFEPFKVEYENDTPGSAIFEGEHNSGFRVRNLFKTIAKAEPIKFRDSVKSNRSYTFNGQSNTTLLSSTPKLIITTGDQVYVDAGYGTPMKNGDIHPISAWEAKRRPKPFDTSLVQYTSYLNKLYNASYSFTEIETAHQHLPVLPAIDDHELRDGWGSQGDEYEEGVMNPQLAGHYMLGKQAFIEHQLLASNYPSDKARQLLDNNLPLHYSFTVNGKNGYVFDLRSARNINSNTVLGEEQWQHFKKWLATLERDQEVILVTSVPLTLRPLKWIEDIAKLFSPELRDDARDGWNSRNNRAERDRLLELLTTYRIEKDIMPIFVSGDIHKSALIEIWVDPNVRHNGKLDTNESMILGYEVVSSGISHEFIKTGVAKSIFKLIESQRIGDGLIEFDYKDKMASIYPMVRKSIVAQNFAAIEFSESEKTRIHTFFYNHTSESLEQHYLELDFDKKMPNDDYFIYTDKDDKQNSKKSFAPPMPDGMRVITDSIQPQKMKR